MHCRPKDTFLTKSVHLGSAGPEIFRLLAQQLKSISLWLIVQVPGLHPGAAKSSPAGCKCEFSASDAVRSPRDCVAVSWAT
eukprot:g38168.t1